MASDMRYIHLEEERFILAQGYGLWSLGSVVSGPVVRQNFKTGSV
jgi:hypothetical protein